MIRIFKTGGVRSQPLVRSLRLGGLTLGGRRFMSEDMDADALRKRAMEMKAAFKAKAAEEKAKAEAEEKAKAEEEEKAKEAAALKAAEEAKILEAKRNRPPAPDEEEWQQLKALGRKRAALILANNRRHDEENEVDGFDPIAAARRNMSLWDRFVHEFLPRLELGRIFSSAKKVRWQAVAPQQWDFTHASLPHPIKKADGTIYQPTMEETQFVWDPEKFKTSTDEFDKNFLLSPEERLKKQADEEVEAEEAARLAEEAKKKEEDPDSNVHDPYAKIAEQKRQEELERKKAERYAEKKAQYDAEAIQNVMPDMAAMRDMVTPETDWEYYDFDLDDPDFRAEVKRRRPDIWAIMKANPATFVVAEEFARKRRTARRKRQEALVHPHRMSLVLQRDKEAEAKAKQEEELKFMKTAFSSLFGEEEEKEEPRVKSAAEREEERRMIEEEKKMEEEALKLTKKYGHYVVPDTETETKTDEEALDEERLKRAKLRREFRDLSARSRFKNVAAVLPELKSGWTFQSIQNEVLPPLVSAFFGGRVDMLMQCAAAEVVHGAMMESLKSGGGVARAVVHKIGSFTILRAFKHNDRMNFHIVVGIMQGDESAAQGEQKKAAPKVVYYHVWLQEDPASILKGWRCVELKPQVSARLIASVTQHDLLMASSKEPEKKGQWLGLFGLSGQNKNEQDSSDRVLKIADRMFRKDHDLPMEDKEEPDNLGDFVPGRGRRSGQDHGDHHHHNNIDEDQPPKK